MLDQNFSVDTSSGEIFELLRKNIYSNPIKAIVREIICNARDANRESNSSDPIQVSIAKRKDHSIFSIKDNGIGISQDRMSNIFLKYLSSSKKDSETQTGGFGLGAKTPFAYTDNFEIITVNQGKKYHYFASLNTKDSHTSGGIMLLSEEDTSECSGTEIIIPIKDNDSYSFKLEVDELIKGFNYPILYTNSSTSVLYKCELATNSHFSYSNGYKVILINLDGIRYSVEYDNINKISTKLSNILSVLYRYNPVLFFKTKELDVSVSRESLRFTEKTKKNILLKLEDFIKEYSQRISLLTMYMVENDYFGNFKILKDLGLYEYIYSLYCSNYNHSNEFDLKKYFKFDLNFSVVGEDSNTYRKSYKLFRKSISFDRLSNIEDTVAIVVLDDTAGLSPQKFSSTFDSFDFKNFFKSGKYNEVWFINKNDNFECFKSNIIDVSKIPLKNVKKTYTKRTLYQCTLSKDHRVSIGSVSKDTKNILISNNGNLKNEIITILYHEKLNDNVFYFANDNNKSLEDHLKENDQFISFDEYFKSDQFLMYAETYAAYKQYLDLYKTDKNTSSFYDFRYYIHSVGYDNKTINADAYTVRKDLEIYNSIKKDDSISKYLSSNIDNKFKVMRHSHDYILLLEKIYDLNKDRVENILDINEVQNLHKELYNIMEREIPIYRFLDRRNSHINFEEFVNFYLNNKGNKQ